VLLPTAAACAVEQFDADVCKVYWPMLEIDALGTRTGNVVPNRQLPVGHFRQLLLAHGPSVSPEVPTSGNAWSRDFLDKVFPMPVAEFRLNADSYLSTLSAVYGEVRALPEAHSLYRVHGTNRYTLMSVSRKSARQLDMYIHRCELLAQHFGRLGTLVDPAVWQSGNWHYDYLQKLGPASEEIASLVPAGASFIFIEDGMWGDERSGTPAIEGRRAIPFIERDGGYFGRPEDDGHAIVEFERLCKAHGPDYAVVVWPAFWWLAHYAGFAAHLRRNYPCVLRNDRIVAFDLTGNRSQA
jgi:hypothetical protein